MAGHRASSKGNPYHYPKGHPLGGQFAPKTYAEAAQKAWELYNSDVDKFEKKYGKKSYNENDFNEGIIAVANNRLFSSLVGFNDYSGSDEDEKDGKAFYTPRTVNRFSDNPSAAELAYAESIARRTGKELKEDPNVRETQDFIAMNRRGINNPVGRQSSKMMHLEEEQGTKYSSNDREGGNAGAYIGSMDMPQHLENPNNWVKHDDGYEYCTYTDEKGHTRNLPYRMGREKIGGKMRPVIERKIGVYTYDEDGRPRRVAMYCRIDDKKMPKTKYKSLVKDDKGEAIHRAALFEKEYYRKTSGQTRVGLKRSPDQQRRAVALFHAIGDEHEWKEHSDGSFSFAQRYDNNNAYDWTIQNSDNGGYNVYRDVTTTHKHRVYDGNGNYHIETVTNTRREWVASNCATPGDARIAAQRHEANSIMKRFDNSKPTKGQLQKWKSQGKISSLKEYQSLLDPIKKFLK